LVQLALALRFDAMRRLNIWRFALRRLVLMPLLVLAQPALAQQAPADSAVEEAEAQRSGSEIVVIAERLRAEVDAAQAPIATYNEEDIAALGANSIGELISALGPQTGSGRGRGGGGQPVMLLNGQRISNFREMRGINPSAIRKVEILPEEVALRFGFPPNQRVMNIILKDNFASRSLDFEMNFPTRGGFHETEVGASLLKIAKTKRINLNLELNDSTLLTEDERSIATAGLEQAPFRSLVPDSRSIQFTASLADGMGQGGRDGSYSLNAAVSRNDARSLFGLDILSLPEPVTRKRRSDTVQGGATLNKPLGGWLLTSTLDASHVATDTRTDLRRTTAAAVRTSGLAQSRLLTLTSLNTLNGRLFRLPAGQVSVTLKAGFDFTRIRSSDTRPGGVAAQLKRGDLSGGINVAIPITSRREGAAEALGDVTLNFSAGINHLSDFGNLTDWSAGLTWAPFEKLSLGASYIVNEAAPSLGELGNPLVISPSVAFFDFRNNRTELVTLTTGGNPALRDAQYRDLKLSANWDLPVLSNSSLLVEYFRNRTDNAASSLPVLTPAVEAAFASRVTRDASGRLTAVDQRAISLARQESSRIRWGFNIGGPVGKPNAAGPRGGPFGGGRGGGFGGPPGGRPPGAGGPPMGGGGGGGGGPPFMAMMGGGNGQGRWNLSLYHTARFKESVLIAPGAPQLNLLAGDALSGGGISRHSLELGGGVFYRGTGIRLNGRWTAPTRINSSNLRFGSITDLDAFMFINFSMKPKVVEKLPILKGVRLAISIENIFDSRQRVTDGTGAIPTSYLPDLLDPRGRMIGFDIRKEF
jgi:iron complex outermembrane recepter protein